MDIAVDFDGTIVTDNFPAIGNEIPFAVETLKMLRQDGHKLILWTVREGELLEKALDWCENRGLTFYAVNREYPEETIDSNPYYSRKPKVDMFIDDRNFGGLPDWGTIYRMIHQKQTWNDVLGEVMDLSHQGLPKPPKKKHWWNL